MKEKRSLCLFAAKAIVIFVLTNFIFISCDGQIKMITIASTETVFPTICSSIEGDEIDRTIKTLSSFFVDRNIETEFINSKSLLFHRNKSFLVLETLESHPLASQLRVDLTTLKNSRDEAHVILSCKHNDAAVILVVGKTPLGIESGVSYLLSKINCTVDENRKWIIKCPVFEEIRNPFFIMREATLCPTGREFPDYPMVNYENWNLELLLKYPPFLKACGFNSLQLMELITYNASTNNWHGGYRGGLPKGKTIDDVQDVLYILMNSAHSEGMRVSQYIWGSPLDGNKWSDPNTRSNREEFYRELAGRYGEKVDHIITHWQDEGNEGGYETPLTATMFIWNEYKKWNPNIHVTCDAWFNPELYEGISTEKYASKNVAIAVERWYDEKRVEQILNSGRKVGIWGWYLSDFEMIFGSKLYTKTLDHYFFKLPEKASEQIDWMSFELCFHGLPSRLNLYVVGRKMWDPSTPLSNIIFDYCNALYGEINAEDMMFVYETVEEGQKEVRYGMVEKDRYSTVVNTPDFQRKVDLSLKKLDNIRLSSHWIPNFLNVASPQDDIKNLRSSLIEFKNEESVL